MCRGYNCACAARTSGEAWSPAKPDQGQEQQRSCGLCCREMHTRSFHANLHIKGYRPRCCASRGQEQEDPLLKSQLFLIYGGTVQAKARFLMELCKNETMKGEWGRGGRFKRETVSLKATVHQNNVLLAWGGEVCSRKVVGAFGKTMIANKLT